MNGIFASMRLYTVLHVYVIILHYMHFVNLIFFKLSGFEPLTVSGITFSVKLFQSILNAFKVAPLIKASTKPPSKLFNIPQHETVTLKLF